MKHQGRAVKAVLKAATQLGSQLSTSREAANGLNSVKVTSFAQRLTEYIFSPLLFLFFATKVGNYLKRMLQASHQTGTNSFIQDRTVTVTTATGHRGSENDQGDSTWSLGKETVFYYAKLS